MGILEDKLQKINWIETNQKKKDFMRDWLSYIFSFDDLDIEKEEYSFTDRDLEAYYIGCDISKPLSYSDKIKVKRYRREDYKR